jgi:hypothetical protein
MPRPKPGLSFQWVHSKQQHLAVSGCRCASSLNPVALRLVMQSSGVGLLSLRTHRAAPLLNMLIAD